MKVSYISDLDSYRQVDCTLYRSPVIDTTNLNKLIEEQLVKSWENGNSINSVVNQLLQNEKIKKEVGNKIASHYSFLREQDSAKVEEYTNKRIEKTKEQYSKILSESQKKYDEALKNLRQQQENSHSNLIEYEKIFNQSQQELNEIQKEIESLNTTKKLDVETLQHINDLVIEKPVKNVYSTEIKLSKQEKKQEIPEEKKGFFSKMKSYFKRWYS